MSTQITLAGVIGLVGFVGLIILTAVPVAAVAPYIITGVMFLVGLYATTDQPRRVRRDRENDEID
jgi:hypothetical protein